MNAAEHATYLLWSLAGVIVLATVAFVATVVHIVLQMLAAEEEQWPT